VKSSLSAGVMSDFWAASAAMDAAVGVT